MKGVQSEQITSFVIPVLSIIVVIALIPLIIMPQLNKIADASKIINQNKDRLQKIIDKGKALQALNDQKDTVEENLGVVEATLPLQKSVATLVLGVNQLAIDSNLKVSQIKVQPGKTATKSAAPKTPTTNNTNTDTSANSVNVFSTKDNLVFSMTMQGNIDQFKTFLESLENAKRLLLIKQFKINSKDGGNFDVEAFISAPFGPLPVISADQVSKEIAVLNDANKKLLDQLRNTPADSTSTEIAPTASGVTDPFQQ